MDDTNKTQDGDVLKESVADLAMKTYTLYFLVMAIILGLLFFSALRKTAKICCWRCMYGSKYIRSEREDPRVPATLFRTPSVLTTLQYHYDKGRSLRSTTKSEATSDDYASTCALEDETARVYRYLDDDDEEEEGEGANSGTTERAEVSSEGDDAPGRGGQGGEEAIERQKTERRDDDDAGTPANDGEQNAELREEAEGDGAKTRQEHAEAQPRDAESDTEVGEGQRENRRLASSDGRATVRPPPLDADHGGGERPSDEDASTLDAASAADDDESPKETSQTGTGSPDLRDSADRDPSGIRRYSTVSDVSAPFGDGTSATTGTPPGVESFRRGRYKKNVGQKATSITSARSTSAKLSKRGNRQT